MLLALNARDNLTADKVPVLTTPCCGLLHCAMLASSLCSGAAQWQTSHKPYVFPNDQGSGLPVHDLTASSCTGTFALPKQRSPGLARPDQKLLACILYNCHTRTRWCDAAQQASL